MTHQTRHAVVRRIGVAVRWSLLAGVLACLGPGLTQAQEEQEDAAASRSEAFVAVEGAVGEDIAGGPLMLAAYGVTWVGLFLYVVRLVSLQQRTLKEVERLSGLLQRAKGQATGE